MAAVTSVARRRFRMDGDFIADKEAPPSPAMRTVLVNLFFGRAPWQHLRGRSMYGGASSTGKAMACRGWITLPDTELTADGAAVAARAVKVETIDQRLIDALIQSHPNIHLVDILRAERARRAAS